MISRKIATRAQPDGGIVGIPDKRRNSFGRLIMGKWNIVEGLSPHSKDT